MHHRLFVTFRKEEADESEIARSYTRSFLINEGFTSQGMFSKNYADWFVVGGRWSGELTKMDFSKEKLKEFCDKFEKKYGWFTNSKNSDEKRRKQAFSLFKKFFPNFTIDTMPYWRDSYLETGFEDDAKIMDEVIFNEIKEYKGKSIYKGKCGEVYYVDFEGEKLSKDFIGKKWVVVVDYHA